MRYCKWLVFVRESYQCSGSLAGSRVPGAVRLERLSSVRAEEVTGSRSLSWSVCCLVFNRGDLCES